MIRNKYSFFNFFNPFSDRSFEQASVHYRQADDLLGQLVGEGLHQEEEQVVSHIFAHSDLYLNVMFKG